MPKASRKTPAKPLKKKRSSPKEITKTASPGYFRFTKDVFSVLVTNRTVFLRLILLVWVALLLLTGLTQHSYYSGLTQSTDEVAGELAAGVERTSIEVGALFVSVISGAASGMFSESQQIFTGIVYLLVWLVVVWLLRHLLSGNAVKLRDGLYNASAPLVSTSLVILAGMLQLLPFALVVSLVATVAASGAVSGMLWTLVGILLVVLMGALTLFGIAGTVFAGVVVTLPGTYPWAALRTARKVAAGYRRRVILRLLWLGLVLFVAALVTMLPTILLDSLTGYSLSFLVTPMTQLVSISLFVYASAYVYLMYRGVIDERS